MEPLQAFPAITEKELAEACKALEQRSADKINGTDWLSVRWTGEELIIRQKRKANCRDNSEHGEELVEHEESVQDEVEEDVTIPDVVCRQQCL